MIKEIREDLDNYQRFVWLNECIVVGQSERDDKHDDKHREIVSICLNRRTHVNMLKAPGDGHRKGLHT